VVETRVITRKKNEDIGKESSEAGWSSDVSRGRFSIIMALAENAIGNFVPAFFLFQRKNLLDYSFANGPEGDDGNANKSEWMTGNYLLSFTEHFINKSKTILLL
jgi:hypothetical protein